MKVDISRDDSEIPYGDIAPDSSAQEPKPSVKKKVEVVDDSANEEVIDLSDNKDETVTEKEDEYLDQLNEDTDDEVTEEGKEETSEKTEEIPDEPDLNITVEEAEEKYDEETKSDAFKPDSDVDAAVDEIVRAESDKLLDDDDKKKLDVPKKSFKTKIKELLAVWWDNKPVRYGSFVGLGLLLIGTLLLPASRYGILNLVGVRVSSSMNVIDSQTRLPLKNIAVKLQGKSSITDSDGHVSFQGLKLGKSQLDIIKRGYADNSRAIVLGWGSNPIGDQELVATGAQFTFNLSDWQSGKAVLGAEAVSGESSATADEQGKIVLTIGDDTGGDVEVLVSAEGYRTETVVFGEGQPSEVELKMVPARKHVFVSNRGGEYDLYKIDVDGKNEELLLKATGKEREVPTVLPKPNEDVVAFVSSRDGDKNSGGFILDGLYIVDSITGESEKVTRSEQLQLLGWSGQSIVYWQVVEGTSAGNPERSKLFAYNYKTGERKDLAAANYFNSVRLVGDVVYYAVSSYAVPASQAKLYSVKVDGSLKETVVNSQVWTIFRTEYAVLEFSAENQKWYEKKGDSVATEVDQQNITSQRQFVDSPSASKTAWVDIRDGKGVLLISGTKDFKEEVLLTLPGLSSVEYWNGEDNIVFRVIKNSETADYFINLDVKDPVKITDVTASKNVYF